MLDWHGLEIDALTRATGSSAPGVVPRTATEVKLAGRGVAVPSPDPFELLRNKLTIRRPEDERPREKIVVALPTMSKAPSPTRRLTEGDS